MPLVGEATNGREALERYRAFLPDVTLMDLPDAGHERHRGHFGKTG